MAVIEDYEAITAFDQWYVDYNPVARDGHIAYHDIGAAGQRLKQRLQEYKTEATARLGDYEPLELLADARVISPKPDLPNISSGEVAGLVRRTARALVQNTPNVEVLSKFENTSKEGILAEHILLTKIIGSDQYSNDMQQNLFSSVKSAFTLGFDCVIPVLLQDNSGSWYIKYDSIHYRDVFPDPGVRDIRESSQVFIRRYLTKGDIVSLIKSEAVGWDHGALKTLLASSVPNRSWESEPLQNKLHKSAPKGYEIITWYSDTGEPFLTFDAKTFMLLRIEKNKDPLSRHPVFFLVLEKDLLQPYGKSQVELVLGRQDFQDLMLNGAMKLWYRNINPSILGYGAPNTIPNLGPGKYTRIDNPNARIEPFEVNTQTLMQFGTISQLNHGSMLDMLGTPDQQTASQGAFDTMSATPQGVEAQEDLVDTTTNNFQKAIEGFFSHYCSYALTIYFQELAATKTVTPNAEARIQLLKAGFEPENFNDDGKIEIDFQTLAVPYYVRCIPGTLVEMEDEKQIRVLNELFVPLSQALTGLAALEDQELVRNAALSMQYIVAKQIELSGSKYNEDLQSLLLRGDEEGVRRREEQLANVEERMAAVNDARDNELAANAQAVAALQEQMSLLAENQALILERLGGQTDPNRLEPNNPA